MYVEALPDILLRPLAAMEESEKELFTISEQLLAIGIDESLYLTTTFLIKFKNQKTWPLKNR